MSAVSESLLQTYAESDALGLADLVRRGQVSPDELVEAAITLIDRLDPKLNAVIHRLYKSVADLRSFEKRTATTALWVGLQP